MTLGLLSATINQAALVIPIPELDFRRITEGLIFRDNFNRANGAVGNGWETKPGGYTISGNQLSFGSGIMQRNSPAPVLDGIFQINWLNIGAGNEVRLWAGPISASLNTGWDFVQQVNLNKSQIRVTGSVAAEVAPGIGGDYMHRAVVNATGSILNIEVFKNTSLSTEDDLTKDGTNMVGPVDTIHSPTLNYYGTFVSITAKADEYFHCGRNIKVTDMESGEKIRLIGPAVTRSVVVESGGEVDIDLSTYALPITRIELLSSGDLILASYQSASGDPDIWGGDIFAAR
jgi:hypothetical protein